MFAHGWRLLLGAFLACGVSWAAPPESRNNLDSLIGNEKIKFVFVGGKGGVGKTTSSSAIASQLSLSMSSATNAHKRVLLISTDPAHSLSDAFRMKFSNSPTPILPDLPNLEVMEVNPTETMKKELGNWAELAKEMGYDPDNKESEGGIGEKIHSFQEWLSGIPGIDEATALSTAIEHIESGRYDLIVFDTAPTGHTLKLLELPTILQIGLDKLESWQATLWGYWELIKGMGSGSGNAGVKEKVAAKLKEYKASISRVSDMITDTERTRFVVVCIAEYLSISESRRLLGELDRFKVVASHVVVNQLVTDYLEDSEIKQLEGFVESSDEKPGIESGVLSKALAAARLTTARRNIQSKYLKDLKSCPEVKRLPDLEDPKKTNRQAGSEPLTVLEVPLLPSEVTGQKAILGFSQYLIGKDLRSTASKSVGVEAERNRQRRAAEAETAAFAASAEAKKQADGGASAAKSGEKKGPDLKKKAGGVIDQLMADPELGPMIKASPKLKKVAEEVRQNPMAGFGYMQDPEVAPFLQKAMDKLMPGMSGLLGGGGGGAGGGGSRKKRKHKGKPDPTGKPDPFNPTGSLDGLLKKGEDLLGQGAQLGDLSDLLKGLGGGGAAGGGGSRKQRKRKGKPDPTGGMAGAEL